MEDIENIKWHPGFYGSIEYILKLYKKTLFYDTEYVLSKESVVMDMLIIRKKTDVVIDNPIGQIFRKYNIVEYKSPRDELSIDDLYKTIGYAGLYKGNGKSVNEIPADDMSISIFRHSYPRELFKSLNELSTEIDEVYPGIYYVRGIINIPLQIVVTKRLEKGKFEALKILAPDADEDEVRKFISETEGLEDKDDKLNADAILQVSVSANRELYERIRSENAMCEALRDLMKDEIDKTVNGAVKEAVKEAVDKAEEKTAIKMLKGNESIDKIIEYTELSPETVINLAKSIGVSVVN
ncbi:MAG: hypothetical protein IJ763_09770 [Lachnospiraceae bacterium]|nr:hypothetical protein [Lachnospiraceae bacterium]